MSVQEIEFQNGGYPRRIFGKVTYKVTNGEDTVWAHAPQAMSKHDVLIAAEKKYGKDQNIRVE